MAETFITHTLVMDVLQRYDHTEQKFFKLQSFNLSSNQFPYGYFDKHVRNCEVETECAGDGTERSTEMLVVIYLSRDECQGYQTG